MTRVPPAGATHNFVMCWRSLLLITTVALGGCHRDDDIMHAAPRVHLQAEPLRIAANGTTQLTWRAEHAATCTASGAWHGVQATSGSQPSSPLNLATNVFSLACQGPGGTARTSVIVKVDGGSENGLDFPGSAATEGTIRFRFTRPLDIYPATYLWRIQLRSQPEYYTTFFWGNDGEFRWDNGFPNSYYGAHPYPYPAPNFVPREQVGPRYWELAVAGLDVLSKEEVEYGRWHTQALRVWSNVFGKYHEFFWDLPDTSKVIRRWQPRSYGNDMPPQPALTWGDAPWNPSKEILDGVLRGVQIYTTALSFEEMLAEIREPLSTRRGNEHIWYLNLDPSPTDIADESGRGHDPEWVGDERPRAYEGCTLSHTVCGRGPG